MRVLLAFLGACESAPEWQWLDTRLNTVAEGDAEIAARRPVVCGDGDLAYVAWSDARSGRDQVWLNRSLDGGTTWEPVELSISGDGPWNARSPALGCDGGLVVVAWEDDRQSSVGNTGVHFAVSRDGAYSFTEPTRLTVDEYGDWRSVEPVVVVVGEVVAVAFADDRSGAFDVRYQMSLDAGETWLEDAVRLDTDEAGAAWSGSPKLALDQQGRVDAAWLDRRDGATDVRMNLSDRWGVPGTWRTADLRVDVGDDAGASDSYGVDLAMQDGRAAVGWHDHRFGATDVLVSEVDVATGSIPEPTRLDPDAEGLSESLFVDLEYDAAGALHAVWRDTAAGVSDVLYRRLEGGTWTEPAQLDVGGGATHADRPTLSVTEDGVAVAWPDLRDSDPERPREDVYVVTSADFGRTWADEVQANDPSSGPARAVFPQVHVAPSGALVFWEDWRSGRPNVYFYAVEVPR